MDEEALVFPTRLLNELGTFRGFRGDADRYVSVVLAPENLSWLRRSLAEDDPKFKQVIPYVVITAGDLVYCYQRGKKGSEARLHDLWSLGVGGHICREDGEEGMAAYRAGFERELREEVRLATPHMEQIIGVVHDDSTPVGAVHFGVVHLIELAAANVEPIDPALAAAEFRPIAEVFRRRESFESWSRFVIEGLWGAVSSRLTNAAAT